MSSGPYQNAGSLLNEHLEKKRGLKSIAFDTHGKKKAPDKATYATVCKTMQHLSIINEVLDANNKKLRKAIGFESIRNQGLMYVLVYELLFGKYKSIRGGGKIKRMIVKHEKELRRETDDYLKQHPEAAQISSGGNGVNFPRYLRVNTLRANVSDIVDTLNKDLSSKVDEANAANKNDDAEETKSLQIYADAHVPDLLVLPPSASSWLHREYEPVKTGQVVLQDKSSCFSALVLAHGLGDNTQEDEMGSFDYIDACAAPGNKTSHLAALVHSSLGDISPPKKKKKGKASKPKSTIFAFERNEARFNILQERMGQFVPPPSDNGNKVAVFPIHGDYLKADPSDPQFANVRAIMLDPSCSGSGIVNSPDRWMEEGGGAKKDAKRITSLSNFQLVALKHAMSFPKVDRIVYSTCSVHDEENEGVVSKALSEMKGSGDENEWELMAPVCLEHWQRRGKEGGIGGLTKDQADCLIRCDGLDGDETNGFFVSFLVRKKLLSGSKDSRKAIDSATTPTYNGEFKVIAKKIDVTTTISEPEEVVAKEVVAKDSSEPAQPKKSKNQPAIKKGPAPAKAAKKAAWKRKQALQKSKRMESVPKKVATKESSEPAQPTKSNDQPATEKGSAPTKASRKRKQALQKSKRMKKKEESSNTSPKESE